MPMFPFSGPEEVLIRNVASRCMYILPLSLTYRLRNGLAQH